MLAVATADGVVAAYDLRSSAAVCSVDTVRLTHCRRSVLIVVFAQAAYGPALDPTGARVLQLGNAVMSYGSSEAVYVPNLIYNAPPAVSGRPRGYAPADVRSAVLAEAGMVSAYDLQPGRMCVGLSNGSCAERLSCRTC
jgi:hypothetical protein